MDPRDFHAPDEINQALIDGKNVNGVALLHSPFGENAASLNGLGHGLVFEPTTGNVHDVVFRRWSG
jgi:hypothetical protein